MVAVATATAANLVLAVGTKTCASELIGCFECLVQILVAVRAADLPHTHQRTGIYIHSLTITKHMSAHLFLPLLADLWIAAELCPAHENACTGALVVACVRVCKGGFQFLLCCAFILLESRQVHERAHVCACVRVLSTTHTCASVLFHMSPHGSVLAQSGCKARTYDYLVCASCGR